MTNPNKAKGTAWESAVRDYLNDVYGLTDADNRFLNPFSPFNVRRAAQEGARDVGDVHAYPFVLECKDVAKPAVPKWLRQARREAEHAAFPYGVVVHKVRRAGARVGAVHIDVATWTRIRQFLGLDTATMRARYHFVPTVRGIDTSCWYLSTSVGYLADLIADTRRAIDSLATL